MGISAVLNFIIVETMRVSLKPGITFGVWAMKATDYPFLVNNNFGSLKAI
jgi:hypothetical protein